MEFYIVHNAMLLGAVRNRRSQSGEGGLSSADKGGFFRCGRPHVLVQKTSDFLKFMVCPHRQGKREVNFSWFCADIRYRRPLITRFQVIAIALFDGRG